MKEQNYTATIVADTTAKATVKAINDVAGWWTENIEGNSHNLNDVFTVNFGETFVTFKIIELVPDEKAVWLVTDCYLHWLNNKKEWKDTKIRFDILTENNSTQIHFTHIGLVPEIECYNDCIKG